MPPSPQERPGKPPPQAGFVWLALAAVIAAVYHGVRRHGFVNFDDPMYLYENSHVTAGLTLRGLGWAWTSMDTLQWQPLTWLGHMLVSEWGGMNPAAHLLANVALHVVNAGLVFHLLRTVTGEAWRSLAGALLFAVHPVAVETVAWASQLKSTLSTAFALLGLIAYVRDGRQGGAFSPGALAGLLLSLLAKPMMVTFPFLLLLLDYWPLRRTPANLGRATWPAWGRLLLAKAPFLLLAAAVALFTAKPWGAHAEMAALDRLDWQRVAAAPCNYLVYLRLFFWPTDLAVLYPSRLDYPPLAVAASVMVLAGISAVAWRLRTRQPALLVGWSWFVLTTLPVSGLLQIGPHDVADRYLYMPGIGLLAAAVWVGADVLQARAPRLALPVLVTLTLGLGVMAARQLTHWTDSLSLWRHAAAVTPANEVRHINLGNALLAAGHDREAEAEFRAAIGLRADNPRPYVNLAVIAQRRGDPAGAIELLRLALPLAPRDARILSNLGSLLDDMGRGSEARTMLERAVVVDPALPEAWVNLGVLRAKAGELEPARICFETALGLRPGHAEARQNLAIVQRELAARPR